MRRAFITRPGQSAQYKVTIQFTKKRKTKNNKVNNRTSENGWTRYNRIIISGRFGKNIRYLLLPFTVRLAAAVALPAGLDATHRYIPWSVKLTWLITKEPVGRILNLSSAGMGWSPLNPDAQAICGAGWPRALQWKIPDSNWVILRSLGDCVIAVGTKGLKSRNKVIFNIGHKKEGSGYKTWLKENLLFTF